eukprot:COSAG01_NODE_53_length_31352_cov_23.122452_34_plen_154_part_00
MRIDRCVRALVDIGDVASTWKNKHDGVLRRLQRAFKGNVDVAKDMKRMAFDKMTELTKQVIHDAFHTRLLFLCPRWPVHSRVPMFSRSLPRQIEEINGAPLTSQMLGRLGATSSFDGAAAAAASEQSPATERAASEPSGPRPPRERAGADASW